MNMTINFEEVKGENTQEHNSQWPKIRNHAYSILLVGISRSRKANALFIVV